MPGMDGPCGYEEFYDILAALVEPLLIYSTKIGFVLVLQRKCCLIKMVCQNLLAKDTIKRHSQPSHRTVTS